MRQIDVSDVLVLVGLLCLGAAVYLLTGLPGLLGFVGGVLTVLGVLGGLGEMRNGRWD